MNTKSVMSIPSATTYPWLLKKHYAKRVPQITHSFGVFVNGVIQGVCTYGIPPSPALTMGICGKRYKDIVLELNRLCLINQHDKNLASYFVSKTLDLLPKPMIIISYADTSMGHVGYVYQATNFLYTGLSDKHIEWQELGVNTHSRNVVRKYSHSERISRPDKFIQLDRPRKHRYVYFCGTRRDKKELRKALRYDIFAYPKGETKKYMDQTIVAQQTIFNLE